MPNSSIGDEGLYEELRQQGNSAEKSARIANVAAARGRSRVGRRGARSGPYDTWTVIELRKRAKELGLKGYSSLNKSDLIDELRNH